MKKLVLGICCLFALLIANAQTQGSFSWKAEGSTIHKTDIKPSAKPHYYFVNQTLSRTIDKKGKYAISGNLFFEPEVYSINPELSVRFISKDKNKISTTVGVGPSLQQPLLGFVSKSFWYGNLTYTGETYADQPERRGKIISHISFGYSSMKTRLYAYGLYFIKPDIAVGFHTYNYGLTGFRVQKTIKSFASIWGAIGLNKRFQIGTSYIGTQKFKNKK